MAACYPVQFKGKSVLVIRTEREDGKQVLRAIFPDGTETNVSRALAKRIARAHRGDISDDSR